MQGLRKREESKFENFFKLVQAEAGNRGCVFFLDTAEAKFTETEKFICTDMSGWLINKKKASDFEKEFLKGTDKVSEFDECYTYIDFKIEEEKVKIIIDGSYKIYMN